MCLTRFELHPRERITRRSKDGGAMRQQTSGRLLLEATSADNAGYF